MANMALSPARLAEVVAYIDFYDAESAEEVVVALGYPVAVLEHVESGKARLHWALDAGRRQGGIEELRAFVTAYDVVSRRLRARRPRLSQAAIDPRLEPAQTAAAPRHADFVPLPKSESPTAIQAVKPSYLVQPHLGVQVPQRIDPAEPTRTQPAPQPQVQGALRPPDVTLFGRASVGGENSTLPFVAVPTGLVQAALPSPARPAPEHVPTGTAAPSSLSPMSLPFVARQAAKEATKLKPEQIDLSLFPLELFADISGGLARGE